MKIKLKDLNTAINVQAKIVDKDSKLAYALEKKNKKAYSKLIESDNGYLNKLEDKKLELALVDEKTKAVLYNEKGNMIFDKESTKKLNDYNKELLEQEVEFEFFVVNYSELSDKEKETISNIDEEEYTILSRFISNIPIENTL